MAVFSRLVLKTFFAIILESSDAVRLAIMRESPLGLEKVITPNLGNVTTPEEVPTPEELPVVPEDETSLPSSRDPPNPISVITWNLQKPEPFEFTSGGWDKGFSEILKTSIKFQETIKEAILVVSNDLLKRMRQNRKFEASDVVYTLLRTGKDQEYISSDLEPEISLIKADGTTKIHSFMSPENTYKEYFSLSQDGQFSSITSYIADQTQDRPSLTHCKNNQFQDLNEWWDAYLTYFFDFDGEEAPTYMKLEIPDFIANSVSSKVQPVRRKNILRTICLVFIAVFDRLLHELIFSAYANEGKVQLSTLVTSRGEICQIIDNSLSSFLNNDSISSDDETHRNTEVLTKMKNAEFLCLQQASRGDVQSIISKFPCFAPQASAFENVKPELQFLNVVLVNKDRFAIDVETETVFAKNKEPICLTATPESSSPSDTNVLKKTTVCSADVHGRKDLDNALRYMESWNLSSKKGKSGFQILCVDTHAHQFTSMGNEMSVQNFIKALAEKKKNTLQIARKTNDINLHSYFSAINSYSIFTPQSYKSGFVKRKAASEFILYSGSMNLMKEEDEDKEVETPTSEFPFINVPVQAKFELKSF